MHKGKKILLLLGLSILFLGAAYWKAGMPKYSLKAAYADLAAANLLETEVRMTIRRKAGTDGEIPGDYYNYVIAEDTTHLYCAQFYGNGNPFYGYLPRAFVYENIRDRGGFWGGRLTHIPKGERVGAIVGTVTETRHYELPLFVLDGEQTADQIKATIELEIQNGTLTAHAESAERIDDGFVLWFHHDRSRFEPDLSAILQMTNGQYGLQIEGSLHLFDTLDEAKDFSLDTNAYGNAMQAVQEGKLGAEITVELYRDGGLIHTETIRLEAAE